MKCPRCWAEKAYAHPMPGWKGALLNCLLLTRMKCQHCYHKFVIPWFLTLGREVTPPSPSTPMRQPAESPPTVKYVRPRGAATAKGHGLRHGSRRRTDAA